MSVRSERCRKDSSSVRRFFSLMTWKASTRGCERESGQPYAKSLPWLGLFLHTAAVGLAPACKTVRVDTALLETRPFYCLNKEGEHCPQPDSKQLIIPKGTKTIYLTWPVTRSNRMQTLEPKRCAILRRDGEQAARDCEIEALTFDALPSGSIAYYTSTVGLPDDLLPGSYRIVATFLGDSGVALPFADLLVSE